MSDSDAVRAYTVRLELVDEPGELLNALEPISANGGNLLSIFHERGNMTPRGHIPVEVDLEATPDRFDQIVADLRASGVNVVRAGQERYSETLSVVLVGHLVDTDLSDTLSRIQTCANARVADISLTAPQEDGDHSSARLRIASATGEAETALEAVRRVAEDKGLTLIEPLMEGSA